MKTLWYCALFGILTVSCKKSGSPGEKEQLLSKVYEDDELRYEFEYKAGGKLFRLKKYPSGAITPNIIYEYGYDASSRLQQKTYINGITGTPSTKYLYERNNAGQVVKHLTYDISGADSGKLIMWATYTYNAQDNMIKENHYFGDDDPAGYRLWEYDGNGAVSAIKLFGENQFGSNLVELWEFSGGTNSIHPGIRKAWVEPAEMELLFYDASTIDISTYSDGLKIAGYRYKMTDRKAITSGTLWGQQVISYTKTFPGAGAGTVISSHKMKYEYVAQ